MATSTERFGFTKPAGSDPASVVPLNSNTDLIELYLGRTQDSIAPMYDDTETYSVGDLRTYESRLYKCNTDILTPETFDPEKWDLTTAVQEGGGSGGASAIEKTQAEYDALTPAQKTNGAIYMVQSEIGEEKDLTERMSGYTSSSGTVSAYNSKNANFLAWHALASEDSFDASVNGEYWAGNGDGAYLQFDFTNPVMILKIGFASYLASNFKIMYSTDGNEYIYAQNVTREAQSGYICTKTDTTLDSPIRDCVSIRLVCDGAEYNVGALHFYGYDSVESVNKIYYMGTEYANTNGGSGGGSGSASLKATVLYDTPITANGTYTLADSYENYDFISIKAGNGSSETDVHTYSVDDIKRAMNDSKVITNPNTGGWFNFTMSTNTITIPNKSISTIYSVIGYKIVGGGGGSSEAEDINYDNTTSQLTADNVQEAIDEVVANANTASEDILTLQNVQGYDAYDETQTYAVGDYAIYNNHVYECTTAVSTAEPFDSTKWSQTSIEQIIDGVKGDVSQLNSNLSNLETLEKTVSGAIVTFTDGASLLMPTLKVGIDPIQDLHGQDSPWAGGAGKNKLPLTVESIKTASDKSTWNNNSITINGITYEIQVDTNGNVLGIKTNGTASGDSNLKIYDGDAEFHGKIFNGCPSNGSLNTYYMQLSNVSVGSDYDLGNETVISQTDTGRWILIINIKSGTTVSNLVFKPMIRLASEQDATFAPYSNICPISGWTEEVITRTGKNLFDKNSFKFIANGYIDGNSRQWTGSKTIKEYPTDTLSNYWNSPLIDVTSLKEKTITYSGFKSKSGVARGLVDENFNVLKTLGTSGVASQTVDLSQYPTAKYLVLSFVKSNYNFDNAQLELGSTATTYEPYAGTTTTIPFVDGSNPLTVYGGTLDVISGLLTVTDEYIASYNGETLPATWISDRDVYTEGTIPTTGAEVCYELATPQTYQLTPTQVKSLLGTNNVWADTGNIELTYLTNSTLTQTIYDMVKIMIEQSP